MDWVTKKMRNYQCTCGNRLFFENSKCLGCGLDTGFCPTCKTIAPLLLMTDGSYQCGNPNCHAALLKCVNYAQFDVCNRCVTLPPAGSGAVAEALCDCCRFNNTIPDLTVVGNQQKWARLEGAKRRLLYDLNDLGLPFGTVADGYNPALGFDFKGDVLPVNNRMHNLDDVEKVYTGHDEGLITINVIEADDVERERARVSLGEPQRTLLGHFRHEIGHYYWDLLVKNRCEAECIAVFGDHNSPDYETALANYYQNGAPANWPENFISAYATMHPWEDFAETWLTYLILCSEYDTAMNVGFLGNGATTQPTLSDMVVECQKLSVALNEMNRSIGLMDAMPKPIVAPVVRKLEFIHNLVQNSRQYSRPLPESQPAIPPTTPASIV